MPDELSIALVELQRDAVAEIVRRRLAAGEAPLGILDACRAGMALVGERFQAGDYFLAELLLSAEIFKRVAADLEPHLAKGRPATPTGTVVLATMKGDIHDLGKNVFATLLRVQGFAVHDLGVDVPPERLAAAVAELQPDFVGFSALLTPAFESMKRAADLLVQAGLRERLQLLIGGGVTTPAVQDFVGADFQTVDATAGVAHCVKVVEGRRA